MFGYNRRKIKQLENKLIARNKEVEFYKESIKQYKIKVEELEERVNKMLSASVCSHQIDEFSPKAVREIASKTRKTFAEDILTDKLNDIMNKISREAAQGENSVWIRGVDNDKDMIMEYLKDRGFEVTRYWGPVLINPGYEVSWE